MTEGRSAPDAYGVESPAAFLEKAAERVLDFAASTSSSPWKLNAFADQVRDYHDETLAYDVASERDAAWMALAHPGLAGPLAEMLRGAARSAEQHGPLSPQGSTYQRCALQIAEVILRDPAPR